MDNMFARCFVQVLHAVGDLLGILDEHVAMQAQLTFLEETVQSAAVRILHDEIQVSYR